MRWRAPLVGLLLVGLASVSPARAARLEYRGEVLSRRQVEGLVAAALRAPRDAGALRVALGDLAGALQGAGYLDARAQGDWDSSGADPTLRIAVEAGARYRIAGLGIDAASPAESTLFARGLGIELGAWAAPSQIDRAIRAAVEGAAAEGHPYAELAVTQFEWSDGQARVRLGGTLGPRVVVSAVRFEGMRATRPDVAERSLGRLAGRIFDPAAAASGRERLLRLGLFRRVEYAGLEGEGDWTRARLVYRVEEPAFNRFEGAVGVQGEGGAAGLARLELGNLAGTGRAIGIAWQSRGAPGEALAARYVEPLLFGTPLRAEATLEHQREDSLFTRGRWSARLSFVLPGRERLEAGYEQDHVLDRGAEVVEADLQSTLFTLERDGRDEALVPRRGARLRLGGSQTFKREDLRLGGSRKSTSSAVEGLAEEHLPLGRHSGIAWALSGAGRFASQPVLGVYERYPLGGAATLRGFDEQALRVDRYLLSRLEWRWFTSIGGQHLAAFWDHAWTFTRVAIPDGTRPEPKHHDGLGLGLRVESRAGVVGVDYGLEPGRSLAEGKLHLQLVTQF